MKQKISTFTNKISRHLSKPERKFVTDITYGMLASGSCLLTDVVDQLHELSKKINDYLSSHGTGAALFGKASVFYKGKDHEAYLSHVKVQITASRKVIYPVLVYGITEHPMPLRFPS